MRLFVEPNLEYNWQGFIKDTPGHSIALDGYVLEGPRFNPRGPWANFNHHHGVSRLETRATCAQVLLAIRQGLVGRMQESRAEARIYVNDCDEDVCLSVYLLQYNYRVNSVHNPLINRLVQMEDMLDTTGGAYAFPADMESLQQLLWVFEPYHQFRSSGKLYDRDAGEFRSIIDDVAVRIDRYIVGSALKVKPDTRFTVIDGGAGWKMVREQGANARLGVYNQGIEAFVSVRELPGARYAYSLGRASQFVNFPIPKMLKALNKAEGCNFDNWGGSDLIAGSPRANGSRLKPEEVKKIVDAAISR